MIPALPGAGAIWGGLIDYGTGAVYDLQPNPLFVKLTCAESVIQPAVGPIQSRDASAFEGLRRVKEPAITPLPTQ